MYELTLILSLMMGGAQSTAELDVNTQFKSLEECNKAGAAIASKLNKAETEVLYVQCELD
ncbi:hypothetical protein AB4343_10975 [Vibrio breoganii]|uniref:Uncharacterized protein n=1 Tax=Vibrio breoganii TaxID=553239 RepID=A0AAP8N0K5_9VIBR|nr:hypothetical protein [Vibrio breoganii]ANO34668.1 hypothetical protein A6E01_15860 [Vibrio breoganii]MDN3714945.1 hypothetical protein [Vibrio breoganii]OED84243.1 hypothetical protein A1QE_02905 [Vibrio breoganii ZF-55]OED97089.1 hypothetical protein A1QG_17710 [Vibrio breoganii ZF-29]PMG08774.1 hypothetical protein BCV00_05210 [Vibrio breoganii]